MAEPFRLLMVCMGNICRSPMAEGALRARLASAGLQHAVEVDSAGTGGWHAGEPPDPRAIQAAADHGVDIAMQRARQLAPGDYDRFDWILCADRDNLREVGARRPATSRLRSALLLEWSGKRRFREIPDPYTGGRRDFIQAWKLADDAAQRIVQRIEAQGPWY